MFDRIVVEGDCQLLSLIGGDCQLITDINGECGQFIQVHTDDYYIGEYSVTPSDQQVILSTNNKVMYDNLVIEPIPSNYGKISWNGSYLLIS